MSVEERKRAFIETLVAQLQERIQGAHQAESRASEDAEAIGSEARRREDAKEAGLQARLAVGHRERRGQAVDDLTALLEFSKRSLRAFGRRDAVGLGALLDVAVESPDGEEEERSLFLLPVGAGAELSGPGGDGFVTVATPASPIGRALLGARVDDTVEVVVAGRASEWTVLDLC